MIDVKENSDGTFEVELGDEETQILLRYAITKIIEEYIEKEKKNTDNI